MPGLFRVTSANAIKRDERHRTVHEAKVDLVTAKKRHTFRLGAVIIRMNQSWPSNISFA
jgi:hypothetical protein